MQTLAAQHGGSWVSLVEGRSCSGGVDLHGYVSGVGGDFAHAKKTPASKAVRAALIEATDYLDCTMVKRDGGEARYRQKERRRRDDGKKTLDLD
ncbi:MULTISPECIES: hypothetical protein [Rhodanobacter]|uniref:hypothetical protein n=1 Tax=Rhodanobacter TaxID=75309 RepID=UPI0004090EE1|nr:MULTISPECIES: hypothetical protein [Rhodanobacter]UJJ55759.1 hypothetical protein LRK53_05060 [Rhodanobacter thiooxydans]